MNKLINLTENNYIRNYTSVADVNSFKLTAPLYNLLPYDAYKSYANPVNMDGAFTDHYGVYHFDFSNGLTYSSGRRLLYIQNLTNLIDCTQGTYTVAMRISGMTGTYDLGNVSCYCYYKNLTTNANEYKSIGQLQITQSTGNQIYKFNFVINSNELPTSLDFGCDFLQWNTSTRNLAFDFEFIGLYKGDTAPDRATNHSFEAPIIEIENSNAILGEYTLNTLIQRHLAQTERHITALDNTFIINFR